MAGIFRAVIILLIVIAVVPPISGQLLSNEDSPSLIDRVLQIIWEPSSLIRMWVGLDQLYNIARSWRMVAKKLASLPFGEDNSMSHVRIQEPRSYRNNKPSVASQLDRFNKMYESSNLSPIVANAPGRQVYNQQLKDIFSNDLHAENDVQSVFRVEPGSPKLPPLFLFQPQEVFLNQIPVNSFPGGFGQSFRHFPPLKSRYDPGLVSKTTNLQRQKHQNELQNQRYVIPYSDMKSFVPPKIFGGDSRLDGNPEEKLNMFLNLLKNLGSMHANNVDSLRRNEEDSMSSNSIVSGNVLQTNDK